MQIIDTTAGRALNYDGQQIPLPALATDATVHVYDTPSGPWVGIQQPGEARPMYAGSGGKKAGTLELEADAGAMLETEKQRAMQRINAGYSAELARILAAYPDAETKTWDKQESEARAWQADNAASTPLIDAIAEARNTGKAELVSRIIKKADAWIAASGAATGKRQALEDAISTATDIPTVDSISW